MHARKDFARPLHETANATTRPKPGAIVWINGIPHVPLWGVYPTRRGRTRLRHSISSWHRSQHEEIVLNPGLSMLQCGGISVRLSPLQFGVMACLVEAKGASVSRDDILLKAWGYIPPHRADDILRAHIAGLRRALRKAGLPDRLIQNVWGGKYRLATGNLAAASRVAS